MTTEMTNAGPPTSDGSGGGSGELGSILGALAMAYGVYQGSRNQDKQNAANRQLAQEEFERNKEMWALQNEYNSPKSQMERFGAAGLNPNLIYGQGNAGNAVSAPRYTAPTQSFAFNPAQQIMQAIPMYQEFELRSANIDNVKAQTENIRSRTVNEALRNVLLDVQGRTKEFDLDTKDMLRPYQLSVAEKASESSGIKLKQEWERLALLKQTQQMNLLRSQAMEKGLTLSDIQMEKNQAEILFMKYRNDWMKLGVTTADNPLLRIFTRMLNGSGYGGQAMEWLQNLGK